MTGWLSHMQTSRPFRRMQHSWGPALLGAPESGTFSRYAKGLDC